MIAAIWAQIGVVAVAGCVTANMVNWVVERVKSRKPNKSGVIKNSGIVRPNCGLR